MKLNFEGRFCVAQVSKDELFASIHVMDSLPAGAFMLVSRVSQMPPRFQVIVSRDGEMRTWTGTLTEANDQTGQQFMPDTNR